jgi:hypothetical protein
MTNSDEVGIVANCFALRAYRAIEVYKVNVAADGGAVVLYMKNFFFNLLDYIIDNHYLILDEV